ncbi:hypothetical protein D6825_02770 [Candidatus Woesearchaeota archaeon]|nr:MAG: hypothetical protein D6825_02770 [Candidatus Woesearchaeota archaeon]
MAASAANAQVLFNGGGFDPFSGGGFDPFNGGGLDPFNGGGLDPFNGGGLDPFNGGGFDPFNGGGFDPANNQNVPQEVNDPVPPRPGPVPTPEVNLAPQILSQPVTSVVLGTTYLYKVVATDPNGDALSYSLDVAPNGMTIDQSGLVLWTPGFFDLFFNHEVKLRVSDGKLAAIQKFNVDVTFSGQPQQPAPVQTAPAQKVESKRESVQIGSINYIDNVGPGGMLVFKMSFRNNGDVDLEDASVKVTVPELGVRSASLKVEELNRKDREIKTLTVYIPQEATPGWYYARLTIDSGSVHRVVHRDFEVR